MTSATESRFLFMGEVEDPDLNVFVARGLPRIYDGTDAAPTVTIIPNPPRPHVPPSPHAGQWVLNGRDWVKCGCGRCFTGPCPSPVMEPRR